MTPQQKRWLIRTVAVLVAGVVVFFAWQHYGLKETETGLVSGNGRIEAVEIDVAAKAAGRLKDIRVREGEMGRRHPESARDDPHDHLGSRRDP